jgi:hypothetical protein
MLRDMMALLTDPFMTFCRDDKEIISSDFFAMRVQT